ncbi:MAG: transposase [Balneolaceae bacterium]|nr:transposase [Balneolaceae bacterium]
MPVASRAYHWAQSLPVKSKTDQIDARLLARYGLERRPRRWQPSGQRLRDIKLLLRERQQLKNQRTQLKNRRHAARQSWDHPASSLRRLAEHIEQINAYITQIDRQLEDLWESDQALSEAIRRIGQITGLGPQSVLKVVAETEWVCPDSESQPTGLLRRTGCSSGPVRHPPGGGPYLQTGQCPPSAGPVYAGCLRQPA